MKDSHLQPWTKLSIFCIFWILIWKTKMCQCSIKYQFQEWFHWEITYVPRRWMDLTVFFEILLRSSHNLGRLWYITHQFIALTYVTIPYFSPSRRSLKLFNSIPSFHETRTQTNYILTQSNTDIHNIANPTFAERNSKAASALDSFVFNIWANNFFLSEEFWELRCWLARVAATAR